MSLRVAAIVVSHDSEGHLPACLGALLDGGAGRIVVVDNASCDGSRAAVAGFADDRVELVALEHNAGFAGGCNRGLEALGEETEVVAFLNPDVAVARGCLGRCAARLEADPRLAGVAPRLMRPDGLTVDSVGQVLDRLTLEVRDRGYGRRMVAELAAERPVLAACGALAVYRRSALAAAAEEGEVFAGRYFCFWEDLELGWRLVNRGATILALPEAVAIHGRGAGAAPGALPLRWRRPAALEACVLSNRWATLIRHLHPRDLALRLPLLVAWDLALVVLAAARRPAVLAALRRRWPLVADEWRRRHGRPRRRLAELPC